MAGVENMEADTAEANTVKAGQAGAVMTGIGMAEAIDRAITEKGLRGGIGLGGMAGLGQD